MSLKNLFGEKLIKTEPVDDRDKRYSGKIIYLDDGGWGFISTPEIPFTRIFFHWSALNPKVNFKTLHKGQTLEFNTLRYEDKGLRAIKIEVVE